MNLRILFAIAIAAGMLASCGQSVSGIVPAADPLPAVGQTAVSVWGPQCKAYFAEVEANCADPSECMSPLCVTEIRRHDELKRQEALATSKEGECQEHQERLNFARQTCISP